jgi:hypothetical protein
MSNAKITQLMNEYTEQIAQFLKPLGYRKRQRNFNNLTHDKLTQVINLFFASRNSPLLQNIFPSAGGEN